jgi:hypothetical protein
MSPFGCRPATVVAQPGMGTTSRAAAVVHQYGHFRRPDGFRFSQLSPAGAWMLATPTIHVYAAARSLHGTTSDRPIPQSSSAKKVVRHCQFSEKVWNLGETSCIKWCNWKCMVSEQSYMSAGKWSLVVNNHLRVAVGHPFLQLGDWRRPHGPPSGSTSHHSTRPATFQWHVGGGALLFPSGRLAGAHKQSIPRSGGKIVLALENSWAVPVKAPCIHRSTTLRCIFLNGQPPTFRKF